jgi:hypothetical protein
VGKLAHKRGARQRAARAYYVPGRRAHTALTQVRVGDTQVVGAVLFIQLGTAVGAVEEEVCTGRHRWPTHELAVSVPIDPCVGAPLRKEIGLEDEHARKPVRDEQVLCEAPQGREGRVLNGDGGAVARDQSRALGQPQQLEQFNRAHDAEDLEASGVVRHAGQVEDGDTRGDGIDQKPAAQIP